MSVRFFLLPRFFRVPFSDAAIAIERAVDQVLGGGARTLELARPGGQSISTTAIGALIRGDGRFDQRGG
jgi:hypothetical protein